MKTVLRALSFFRLENKPESSELSELAQRLCEKVKNKKQKGKD